MPEPALSGLQNVFSLFPIFLSLTWAFSETARSQNQAHWVLLHWLISLAFFAVFVLVVVDTLHPPSAPLKGALSLWTSAPFWLPAPDTSCTTYSFPASQ